MLSLCALSWHWVVNVGLCGERGWAQWRMRTEESISTCKDVSVGFNDDNFESKEIEPQRVMHLGCVIKQRIEHAGD